MSLADKVWLIVEKWTYFQLDTVGKQWVRAVDSVSLNIGEGFGRNTFKDQRNFLYFFTWLIVRKQNLPSKSI